MLFFIFTSQYFILYFFCYLLLKKVNKRMIKEENETVFYNTPKKFLLDYFIFFNVILLQKLNILFISLLCNIVIYHRLKVVA